MMRVDVRAQDGFTLLEVLVALSIVVIGIVAAMQLFPTSLLQARMAAERTITAEIANSRFGEIRVAGAEALFEGKIPTEILNQALGSESALFGYRTSIQRMPGAAETQLQRITLVMEFADGREEIFVTYVARQ